MHPAYALRAPNISVRSTCLGSILLTLEKQARALKWIKMNREHIAGILIFGHYFAQLRHTHTHRNIFLYVYRNATIVLVPTCVLYAHNCQPPIDNSRIWLIADRYHFCALANIDFGRLAAPIFHLCIAAVSSTIHVAVLLLMRQRQTVA